MTLTTLALAALPLLGGQTNVQIDLGGSPQDVELDAARHRLYVSVPSRNLVLSIDTQAWVILDEVPVSPSPRGLSLSHDGTRLFVALSGAGAVAVLDPDTWSSSTIFLTEELGHSATYDVVEAQPDRLFVSSAPSSGGFAWIVQVLLDQGNVASRVASNRIIRCSPTFEVGAGEHSLYIGECFSPNSVYRLDLDQSDAPIVGEDDHGQVSGSWHIEASPDGSKLHLASGQILTPDTISVMGQLGSGVSRYDSDPTRLFVGVTPNRVQTWNTNTLALVDELTLPCNFSQLRELVVLPGETGFLLLGDEQLCGVADLAPCVSVAESTCAAAPNSAGDGALLGTLGEPLLGVNDFALTVTGGPANQPMIFFYGTGAAPLAFGDGWLCISPFTPGIRRLPAIVYLDESGAATLPLDFTAAPFANGLINAFSTWSFQSWYRDPQGPGGTGFNTSSGLRLTFCP